jgi:hypothetical protein
MFALVKRVFHTVCVRRSYCFAAGECDPNLTLLAVKYGDTSQKQQKCRTQINNALLSFRPFVGGATMNSIGKILFVFFLLQSGLSTAQETQSSNAEPDAAIEQQIQDLKKQLISLNRDLFILEEDLLFPSSTQVAVYLSMDVGDYFTLDSVELKIDDKTVTHYLYTERQIDALYRGGVQRLYVGNIGSGEHEISAFFTGIGPESREYKRAVAMTFDKDSEAKALALSVVDSTIKHQPEFKATEL